MVRRVVRKKATSDSALIASLSAESGLVGEVHSVLHMSLSLQIFMVYSPISSVLK